MKKIRWGIISTAEIGTGKVIPAIQKGKYCEVVAIASRNKEQAAKAAARLNIPTTYGSYEDLLQDAQVDAVYIPLPNHMHVDWAIKALQAGKHVLCEKPIGLSVAEAKKLQAAAQQYPQQKIMEAFMYRFHPQWQLALQLVKEEAIGSLQTIHSFFSFYNTDPANIRNQKEMGGGAMMDIGCYCLSLSRFLFGKMPVSIIGKVDWDAAWGTDRISSGIMDFGNGTSTFTCSTQLIPYQRVQIIGAKGRIEIEIPFNAPPDKPTKLWLHTEEGTKETVFPITDQYTLEADAFAQSVLNNTAVPTPLEDAIENMQLIEAFFKSAEEGREVRL